MTTVYFDTDVLVAAVLASHPHHAVAEAALRKVHSRAIKGWIGAHGLAELYAVLTRVPLTPPVYPGEAWQILERDVFPHFDVISLSTGEYRKTLGSCAAAGWSGGRVYDALHDASYSAILPLSPGSRHFVATTKLVKPSSSV